jgi:hypothetical protein
VLDAVGAVGVSVGSIVGSSVLVADVVVGGGVCAVSGALGVGVASTVPDASGDGGSAIDASMASTSPGVAVAIGGREGVGEASRTASTRGSERGGAVSWNWLTALIQPTAATARMAPMAKKAAKSRRCVCARRIGLTGKNTAGRFEMLTPAGYWTSEPQ